MSNTFISPAQPCLFLSTPQTQFGLFLAEVRRLITLKPEILHAIDRDLDRHGMQKKAARIADKQYLNRQAQVPGLEQVEVRDQVPLHLQTGRPRMSAEACLFFWMVCSYTGGPNCAETRDLLYESLSVWFFCLEAGISIPGKSTLSEMINAISDETRQLIMDGQIEIAGKENFDDFAKVQLDSTPVKANIAWPTDSGQIWKTIKGVDASFKKFRKQGLGSVDYKGQGALIGDLKFLDFRINCTPNNKPEARKALYNELLEEAEVGSQVLFEYYSKFAETLGQESFKPTKHVRLEKNLKKVRDDLENLERLIQHCHERINEGISRPVTERVLSNCDPDAAYMKKGNREPKIGYHPQLARSEQGFVTAIIVPKGYTSDASELQPLCEQAIRRTGRVPTDLSADGGYASKQNRNWLLEKGVINPSFSSSKGRKITPEEDWDSDTYRQLRRWRSAVEALMSQIKGLLGFGQVKKRGVERVRAELTDKVIVFNFLRMNFCRIRNGAMPAIA